MLPEPGGELEDGLQAVRLLGIRAVGKLTGVTLQAAEYFRRWIALESVGEKPGFIGANLSTCSSIEY